MIKLRISHFPQIPYQPFTVEVEDLEEAKKIGEWARKQIGGIGMSKERFEEILKESPFNQHTEEFLIKLKDMNEITKIVQELEETVEDYKAANKELEEIKELFEIHKIQTFADRKTIPFNLDDIEWLIEQAKEKEFYEVQSERKTEALEEIISLLQDDYFENWEKALEVAERNKNDFVRMEKLKDDVKIRTTKELLIEQNKRYREVLKNIYELAKYDEYDNTLEQIVSEIEKASEEKGK